MTQPSSASQTPASPHPMQPLAPDARGTLRFRKNQIVDHLVEWARPRGMGLNELRALGFADDEWQQFAQLIGYSLDGWSTLTYVTDEAYELAMAAVRRPEPEGGIYAANSIVAAQWGVPEMTCFKRLGHPSELADLFARAQAAIAAQDQALSDLECPPDPEAVERQLSQDDAGAQFNAAIDFAIENQSAGIDFLRAWREGDTSEWPEFTSARGNSLHPSTAHP